MKFMIRLITNVVGMKCPLKQTGPSTDFVDGPENSKKRSLNSDLCNLLYRKYLLCQATMPKRQFVIAYRLKSVNGRIKMVK